MPDDDILLLQSQFQAFADHLIHLSIKRCGKSGIEMEEEALKEFTNYVNGAFVDLGEDDMTLEFRIRADVHLEFFVDKMIQYVKSGQAGVYSTTITVDVFRSIRSLLCPGFFPFC
jgi:hypothetical protein